MDDDASIRWLHRRAGLGLAAGSSPGDGAVLDALVAPAVSDPDPWDGLTLDPQDDGRRQAIVAWILHLLTAQDTYRARRTLMLHGWLVSALDKVVQPTLMVEQIRLLDSQGGGSYPALLRAITVDPAMLVYLDGRTSTGRSPNENYGRELMELFALGVGEYDEADVRAAAAALTGWVVRSRIGDAQFVPSRHDPTPQTLVGVTGVDDVASVVDALVGHPAHVPFVARRIVREYLGDPAVLADAVEEVGAAYATSGLRLDDAISTALRIGMAGTSTRLVLAPMPWLAISVRATGAAPAQLARVASRTIRQMGQLPMLPPNVGGWPSGTAWFGSSSLVARSHVAAELAAATGPDAPIAVAAADADLDTMAEQLCLAEPFGPATTAALAAAQDPTERLTLALLSPEHLTS